MTDPQRLRPGDHDRIVARSRALHRAVASRIQADEQLLDIARSNLERWIAAEEKHGRVSRGLLEWRRRFEEHTVEEILAFLCEESERADQLRHATPFCGVLSQEERDAVYKRYAAVST